MADEWTTATWADVVTGDFIKTLTALDTIFRVDAIEEIEDDLDRKTFRLFTPGRGAQAGKLRLTPGVRIRTRKDGKLTPAGQRFDGLSPAGARALKEQLGAEMVGVQASTGATFQPYICQGTYGSGRSLADHLSLFHALHTGDVARGAGPELRRTHAAFHAARPDTATGTRIPHIHNDDAFRKELP